MALYLFTGYAKVAYPIKDFKSETGGGKEYCLISNLLVIYIRLKTLDNFLEDFGWNILWKKDIRLIINI